MWASEWRMASRELSAWFTAFLEGIIKVNFTYSYIFFFFLEGTLTVMRGMWICTK
jgi:hypothetical protein